MKLRLSIFLCVAAALTWSCSDNTITNPQDIVFPDSSVSFGKHVQPFLNLSCAYSGCHGSDTRAGNIAFASYGDLFFPRPLISFDKNVKVENQILVMIIEGRLGHSPALFQERATQNQKTGIRKWISEGAQNN